jgi:hypothetical protein
MSTSFPILLAVAGRCILVVVSDRVAEQARTRWRNLSCSAKIGLPKGLFHLDDMQEFGYNREAGFMCLVRGKKKAEHTFRYPP